MCSEETTAIALAIFKEFLKHFWVYGIVIPLAFILLFRIGLAIRGIFCSLINVKVIFSKSEKNVLDILIVSTLNL